MTSQKIAVGLVAVALFVGSMTAHAADLDAGFNAYYRGDYATALPIFRQLADQGDAAAQLYLGFMYSEGEGVTQDYAAAVRWFRKAANQGEVDAQSTLGVMYLDGKGVPQDYAAAVKWFRKAANQGEAYSQYKLGYMYSDGRGVPQDYAQAHMWFNLAAAKGDNASRIVRDRIAKLMTPAQIAEAQMLALEWKPKGK